MILTTKSLRRTYADWPHSERTVAPLATVGGGGTSRASVVTRLVNLTVGMQTATITNCQFPLEGPG